MPGIKRVLSQRNLLSVFCWLQANHWLTISINWQYQGYNHLASHHNKRSFEASLYFLRFMCFFICWLGSKATIISNGCVIVPPVPLTKSSLDTWHLDADPATQGEGVAGQGGDQEGGDLHWITCWLITLLMLQWAAGDSESSWVSSVLITRASSTAPACYWVSPIHTILS